MASSRDGTLGDGLIPLINRLQDIFSQVTVDLKLSLPQVAVVGGQSSGKSSVLEALVGRDFLPRGSDIVTRRPLVLQLVKTSPGNASEWGEFLHAPGKVFDDFSAIRDEIQAETERLVGHNKNVSDKPIRLKIFSPHVLTMTLVDLPGMTRVPVGDQPSNIEQRIRDMVLEYIRNPSCIVLAVTPANSDLASSDALHIARMVDPDGARTIGVLTKLDIMDRGTNAGVILRNAHIPLRLGYVGVVLRSQQDINNNTAMADARRAESAFFASRPEYCDVAPQCGTGNLARRLSAILVDHIRTLLPGLRRRIQDLLEQRTAELAAFGDAGALESKSARGAFLLQLLCDYSERLGAMLDGRHVELTTHELSGGARLRHVFIEGFGRTLKQVNPVKGISDEEISTVIKNGAGVTGNLLVPQEPFELLVRRAISLLLQPSLQCKEAVHDELLRIAEAACPRHATRFPTLQRSLAHAVMDFIRGGAEPAEKMIRALVECEHDYINCDHPEFIGGRGAIRAVMQERSVRVPRGAGGGSGAGGGGGGARGGTGGSHHSDHQFQSGGDAGAPGAARDSAAHTTPKHRLSGAPGGSGNGGGGGDGGGGGSGSGGKGGGGGGGGAPRPSGLKGLGDTGSSLTQPMDDLFISTGRARRRSDDGPSSGKQQHASHILHGNGNGDGGAYGGPGGNGGKEPGGSSWFSWFARQDSTQPAQQQQMLGGGRGGHGHLPHPASTGAISASAQMDMQTPRSGRLVGVMYTEQEELEVEVIRKLVDSYFEIVRKTMLDQVPKAIMHFMVNRTKRGLQQHLIQQLYRDDCLDELLAERPEVVTQRKACAEAVAALQAAASALEEVPVELSNLSVLGPHGQPPLLPGALTAGRALSLQPSGFSTQALSLHPSGFSTQGRSDGGGPSFDPRDSMDVAARVATMASYTLHGSGPGGHGGGSHMSL
ncbi:hypothetical protein FOA52_007890 [Chlamydomonas sp. UWO 241]|nr:hypothetical protein FOA52_007890 [Chlamydomonas sp. UWO 241]